MECKLASITVHYEVKGSGIPVLMIHGFGCDHRLMTGSLEPIFAVRPGYQRIYIDLPGMGLTKGEEWIQSSDDMLSVVEQFIDEVLPDQHFVLAGESYGGYLSRALVSRRPEQIEGLLLIAPSAGKARRKVTPFTIIYKDEAFLEQLQHRSMREFTEMQVIQDAYNWERFHAEILCGVEIADTAFLERISPKYDLTDDTYVYAETYEKPVLILSGRQDHVVGYQNQWKFAQQYPRATFAVLDRAGHNLQIEQNNLFHALVSEWLDRVEESTSL
ncbi:MAG: 2-hydroxy-6-oxo-6-phenylhexa-2,4-dienoate hydrolase [Paenibacillus sp. RIFOXYA1_FULL_44_5]|nr:MAG: 2-hydroxy-6-oxo-6-phenylhexa-2,4-dienoate hydrolase [Paenibacillus sp. RIFOXYA1_FULL_44_5]